MASKQKQNICDTISLRQDTVATVRRVLLRAEQEKDCREQCEKRKSILITRQTVSDVLYGGYMNFTKAHTTDLYAKVVL